MKSRIILATLCLIGLGVLVVPAIVGWHYYTMPREKQIRLPPEQKTLRSSGTVGHGYGIAGSLIMLLNFLYLIRKRYGRRAERFGNMRNWMHFHVFVGLIGPILIFYHTAFVMSNVFAKISLIALLIVVATGIFGRFIYATIPRDMNGYEQNQAQIIEQLQGATDEFHQQSELITMEFDQTASEEQIEDFLRDWLPPPALEKHNAVLLLFFLFGEQVRIPIRKMQGTKMLMDAYNLPKKEAKAMASLWLKYRRFTFFVEVLERHRRTLSSWRALHRTLTYVMVFTAIVHVFIATVGFGML